MGLDDGAGDSDLGQWFSTKRSPHHYCLEQAFEA